MRIGVLVTSRNDIRLLRTLESLRRQSLNPDAVVVGDGSDDEWLSRHAVPGSCQEQGAIWLHERGASVPRARNLGVEKLGDVDVVAFLDTDESAPESWLETLTEPILKDEADFTGGPTRPSGKRTRYSKYLEAVEVRHYQLVAQDIGVLPMGNSAWRREVFEAIGGFDESFILGGEDYDVSLRALDRGYRGRFVSGAWVWHDQSHLDTAGKIIRRKWTYMVGAAMAYTKNGVVARKVTGIIGRPTYWHWLEVFNSPLRLLAYLRARRLVG